jgi:muconolactone delta-isomerase
VLLTLVVAYAETTPADMWTDALALRIKAPRAKRSRDVEEEKEVCHLVRRSAQLRQKHIA